MTALSADTKRDAKRSVYDMYHEFPVSASTTIYEGGGIVLNGGYAEPATAATSLVTVGVAQEFVDNSSGSDGDLSVKVRQGIFGPFASGTSADLINADDVGALCYWSDDNTVNLTDDTGSRSAAGIVYDVTSDGIFVLLGIGLQS